MPCPRCGSGRLKVVEADTTICVDCPWQGPKEKCYATHTVIIIDNKKPPVKRIPTVGM